MIDLWKNFIFNPNRYKSQTPEVMFSNIAESVAPLNTPLKHGETERLECMWKSSMKYLSWSF